MKILSKLKQTLTYYPVLQTLVLTITMIYTKDSIYHIMCNNLNISEQNELYRNALQLCLAITWFSITFKSFRNARYQILTGRNYQRDHNNFKRSYHDLVEYFKDADPRKLDTSSFKKISWKNTKGIIFGKDDSERLITIPTNSESNIAVFGPPGSGKTSGIAIINAASFDGSILAVDIKGDIYSYISKHTNRQIKRFCPDDPNALKISARFDPFDGLEKLNQTELKIFIENMATILIPDEGGGSDGNYFTSRARKMFQGITLLILYENHQASFPDVIHQILQGNIFDWVKTALKSDCETSKEFLASFYGNSEKNISSAYDALTTALINFSNPILNELLSKSDTGSISVKTLENGTDIYLQITQEHLTAYAPLFTLIIQKFSMDFTKRPDSSTGARNRPILFLLDEFPQLTFSYQLINSNLSTLRSKSIICMLIQQNLSQLEYRYQPIGARSILGNCNYQIILGSNDIRSSQVFSDTFGRKKVLKISNSETNNKSTGRSIQEATDKIFQPEDFGDLPSNNRMIIYFKGKYCECNKLNCYKKERN